MVRHAAVTLWSRLPGNDPVMGGDPAERDFWQPDHTARGHAATRREETRVLPAVPQLLPAPRRGQGDRSLRPDAAKPRPGPARNANITAGESDPVGLPAMPGADTRPADAAPGPVPSAAESDAEQAITAIYGRHYWPLVRVAAALVGDVGTAEEVVQDAFIAMCGAWSRLRDRDKALAYVRQSVLNRSRSVLRHRTVADRTVPEPAQDMPSAEHGAITLLERSALISAMRALAPRQREALVLRFYLDLSEGQVASAMGISRGTVKCHTARAKAALRSVL
jgi:RNA polymerase sigma-70 factor (sigma-E family)